MCLYIYQMAEAHKLISRKMKLASFYKCKLKFYSNILYVMVCGCVPQSITTHISVVFLLYKTSFLCSFPFQGKQKTKYYLLISLFSCLKEFFSNMIKLFPLKQTNVNLWKNKQTKTKPKRFYIILDIEYMYQCLTLRGVVKMLFHKFIIVKYFKEKYFINYCLKWIYILLLH